MKKIIAHGEPSGVLRIRYVEGDFNIIYIQSRNIFLREVDGAWVLFEKKGITIEAVQTNLHGFFKPPRWLQPNESDYKEVECYLA